METTNTISWLHGSALKPSATTNAPKAMPPPRMRQSVGRCSCASSETSSAPETDTSGIRRPNRNTVW